MYCKFTLVAPTPKNCFWSFLQWNLHTVETQSANKWFYPACLHHTLSSAPTRADHCLRLLAPTTSESPKPHSFQKHVQQSVCQIHQLQIHLRLRLDQLHQRLMYADSPTTSTLCSTWFPKLPLLATPNMSHEYSRLTLLLTSSISPDSSLCTTTADQHN